MVVDVGLSVVVVVGRVVVVVPVPTSICLGIIGHVLMKVSLWMTVPSGSLTVRTTVHCLPDCPPILTTEVPGPRDGLGVLTSLRPTTL